MPPERKVTPPMRGMQLDLISGRDTPAQGPRRFGPAVSNGAARLSHTPPLFEGIHTAKRVPSSFFHPPDDVAMEQIAWEFTRHGRLGIGQIRRLEAAHDFLSTLHRTRPNPKTGTIYVRDDGSDYLQHAMRVAYRIAVVGRGRQEDLQQVQAALLHDSIEDFGVRLEEIREIFGAPVSEMALWLTKPKWDGKTWVYPDSEAYYSTQDSYDHSMYDRRGYSYYRRLYYVSGNTSSWVIKSADNLDNLHTLKNVRPEKRQRNARLIVNNTMAVLSRMLAQEDIEWLVKYIENELGFEVPRDAIANAPDSQVSRCPPREVLVRQGLEGVHAPRYGQINVYGADPRYLLMLGWLEIGLPDDGNDYLGHLRSVFREYTILPMESYLPPGLAASERIFRVMGCRRDDQFSPYETSFDPENRRVHLMRDGKPIISLDLASISSINFDDPQLKALCSHLTSQCEDFVSRLEQFRQNFVRGPELCVDNGETG